MHRVLVEERKWIDEPRYLNALNFCMLLPGPEAMQLATYVGWRLHGVKGGLAAGLLFVLPGALVVLALSMLYAAFGKLPVAEALFVGIKAAVLAIVVEALLRIARRSLKGNVEWLIAGAAFVAIFFLAVPFPLIVLAAALVGFLACGDARPRHRSAQAQRQASRPRADARDHRAVARHLDRAAARPGRGLRARRTCCRRSPGSSPSSRWSRSAAPTRCWPTWRRTWCSPTAGSTAGEMLDGLGLAETTPGPLILVTEFVGFLAAHRHGGGNPWAMGVLGALVTLWATFAPCFLWIFAGAPYIERLNAEPRLKSALAAVTAAVVGVILNLTVWFALHVLFARVSEQHVGPAAAARAGPGLHIRPALLLSALAVVLLFVLHRGVLTTLAVCGALALAWHWRLRSRRSAVARLLAEHTPRWAPGAAPADSTIGTIDSTLGRSRSCSRPRR